MSNIQLNRDHQGKLHLQVAGQYASGAKVSHIADFNGELAAVVIIPLKDATIGEVSNVVPFVAPENKQEA